jgi:hypothetical protein
MGRIEAGKVAKGDKLVVLPSGQSATVKDIQTLDGSLESATAGQSVTLLLDEYLDISRGDLLAAAGAALHQLKTVNADVCWLSDEPLDLRRKYWLKHTTKQVARVAKVDRCWTSTPSNAVPPTPEAERHRPHQRERAAAHRGRCLPGHPRHRRLHPDRRSDPPDGGRWYDSDRLNFLRSAIVSSTRPWPPNRQRLPLLRFTRPSPETPGMVWLIGSGPGAADLMTVRAARLLAQADIVLHDALVTEEMLALCPQAVQVGRQAQRPALHGPAGHQPEAGRGRAAIPPRGAPERRRPHALRPRRRRDAGTGRNHIPYEIVPGITAALAAASAAKRR